MPNGTHANEPAPSDAELAAARLTASALAVALGLRALEHAGQAKTVEALMRLTGYGQSQVYEARALLKGRWPDLYRTNGTRDDSDQALSAAPESDSGQAELVKVPTTGTPGLRAPRLADRHVDGPAPTWKRCLAERALAANGRSWDLYDAVYAPAWDAVLEATKDQPEPPYGDLIALTVHYVETVDGLELDAAARKQVAMLVRSHGKAALYGWTKALGITDHEPTARFRYARQVAERVVEDMKGTP